jgi:hypothetical protein
VPIPPSPTSPAWDGLSDPQGKRVSDTATLQGRRCRIAEKVDVAWRSTAGPDGVAQLVVFLASDKRGDESRALLFTGNHSASSSGCLLSCIRTQRDVDGTGVTCRGDIIHGDLISGRVREHHRAQCVSTVDHLIVDLGDHGADG